MSTRTTDSIVPYQKELAKLYEKESELKEALASYQTRHQEIEKQQQAAFLAQERAANGAQRRRHFANKYSGETDQFQQGVTEKSRDIVSVAQHSGELTNAAQNLDDLIKTTRSQLNDVQTEIAAREQTLATPHLQAGDMPLSQFKAQKQDALPHLMKFIFDEKRSQPQGHPLYRNYGFDSTEGILAPENLNAARNLIAAYNKTNDAVHKNHRLIVKTLSILLSNTATGRIPKNCRSSIEELGSYNIGSGVRRNVHEAAKKAMKSDEKTTLSKEEPSAVQFYRIQEWMVQILIKNYLAQRWELHKNDGSPNQEGFIQLTPSESQTLERANDGCLGLYNFFRSRSKSEARREHALETIQLIRQAMDVNELMELLGDRIKDNQKGYFSHSSSSHSLDENYRILITIADYANQTTQKTEWNANSTITNWQESCLQAKFDGYCGLFATHAHGLRL